MDILGDQESTQNQDLVRVARTIIGMKIKNNMESISLKLSISDAKFIKTILIAMIGLSVELNIFKFGRAVMKNIVEKIEIELLKK